MKIHHPSLAGGCALAMLLFPACSEHATETKEPADGPPVAVSAESAALSKHQATEDVVGTVRSKTRALVEAKVSGRILKYLAVPGQTVKSGEILAEIDAREITARREQVIATLDQANRDLARYKQLIETHAVSRQEYDAAEARQKVATAALTEIETMLGYASVTAPFDGIITRKLADVGDLAMPGKPLMEIEAPSSLRFEADLPETMLGRVKLGDHMPVAISSLDRSFDGTVSEIAPIADSASRTFQVKFDLPPDKDLRTGQFGRVSVPVAETEVLRVPREAVIKRGQLELVYVVKDGHVRLRLVRTGRDLNDGVGILSGLEDGEMVVVKGGANLADGSPVTIQP